LDREEGPGFSGKGERIGDEVRVSIIKRLGDCESDIPMAWGYAHIGGKTSF